jgi:hypothetical protein
MKTTNNDKNTIGMLCRFHGIDSKEGQQRPMLQEKGLNLENTQTVIVNLLLGFTNKRKCMGCGNVVNVEGNIRWALKKLQHK